MAWDAEDLRKNIRKLGNDIADKKAMAASMTGRAKQNVENEIAGLERERLELARALEGQK